MRGEVWEIAGAVPAGAARIVVVQHDALADAPTVVGLLVTDRPQTAGPPLTIALEPGEGGVERATWVKTTQVHTVAAADARRRLGRLSPARMVEVDSALAEVLAL